MSTQVQYRRGTGPQNDSFTGALAEITVNTTDWTLRVHDGLTAGGAQALVGNSATQTLTNKTLGAFTVAGNITGNLLPSANTTFNLGSNTQAWNSLYVAGNTIYLGALQLKDAGGNTFAIYTSDGVTQANIDVGAIDVSSISQGNSAIGIAAPNGNAYITVGGNANVLLVTSTGISTTGTVSSSGNATVGNLGTAGNVNAGNLATTGLIFASGNISGDNFFIAGNASASGNVLAVGNVIGGNLETTGLITATGNITAGNILAVGALGALGQIIAIGNIETNASIIANGIITTTGTVTAGNLTTSGTISASGNANVGNLGTTGVFATTMSASGNANVGNLGTTGIFATTLSATGNANVGNLGTAGVFANTVNTITLSATGNANVGNLGTAGVFANTVNTITLSATGNITTDANILALSGHISVANGLYTTSAYDGTYVDGIVIDYITGNGRITTGSADGLLIQNNGVASPTTILEIDAAGNVTTNGTVSAAGNVYSNTAVYVGAGAANTGLTNPIIVAKSTGLYYIQVAAQNSANTGSADLVSYADNGSDTEAWVDMGFTGSGFNDTAYTITKANDGYVFVQGGVTGGALGGNLVLATGNEGTTHDIVFATGGFLEANEKMRFIDAAGQFYIQPATAAANTSTGALRVVGGAGIGGNIYAGGLVSASGEIIATGNVSGNNLNTLGVVSSAGTVTGGNLSTAGTVTATGNATVGNLSTGGTVTATGNIVGGNIVTSALVQSDTVSATGTVTAGNIVTGGTVTATGNIQSNGTVTTNAIASISGALTVSTNSGDLILNAGGNIDASTNYVNNLLNPVQAQDAATKEYVDNAVSTGITIHDPVLLESPIALNATYAQGGNAYTVNQTIAGNTVVFSTAANVQPNDQLWFSNSFEGIVGNTAYFVVSAPNTSAAVLSLSYSGAPVNTITSNTGLTESVRVNSGVGATLTNAGANATLQVDGVTVANTNRILLYQQANAAHNGVYVVTEAGNATTAWQLTRSTDMNKYGPDDINGLDAGDYVFVQSGDTGAGESYVMTDPIGPFVIGYDSLTFTQFSSSQVYSANTSAGLSLTGTVFSAKVDNDTTAFSSGNIVVKAGANLTTPNIGAATGTSLSLTGTATVGNVSTVGTISATGNVTGDYFFGNGSQLTGIDATSIQNGTSNVRVVSSGGDVTTSVGGTSNVVVVATTGMTVTGIASVTGNAIVGNISTAGEISATGNITGGNILGGANVNATLFTGTTVSVTGNVDGGNILSSALIQGVTLSATGNVNGANLNTGGTISAAGTITGGNLVTGGTLSVGGTTTAATINAGNVSASGNVTGGNVLFGSGIVSGTGNITGGNVLFGSGIVSGTGNIAGGNASITGNISSVTAAQNANTTQLATTAFVIGQASSTTPSSIGTNTIGTSTTFARADHTHTGVASLANGGGITASVSTGAVTLGSTATNTNTAGAIVARDGSGNFSAGTITATLSGAATTAGTVTTAAQGNITSVGTLTSLTVSSGGVHSTGSGNDFSTGGLETIGNGVTNTVFPTVGFHQPAAYASSIQLRGAADFRFYAQGAASFANVTAANFITSGSGGNITGANVVSATTILTSQIQNSGSSGVGNIGNSTTFFNTVFAKATSAQYADLAEAYAADAEYPPGTVLVFGGDAEVTIATVDGDTAVAGVVSTNPAHVMNSGLNVPNTVILALTGRVPTRVVGPVRKGQMMISAENGYARACATPAMGSVIGKALENFDGESGVIEVVVGRL